MNNPTTSTSKWLAFVILSLALIFVIFVMLMGVFAFYQSYNMLAAPTAALTVDEHSTPTVLLEFDGPVNAWLEDPHGKVEVGMAAPDAGFAVAEAAVVEDQPVQDRSSEWQEVVSAPTALMLGQRVRTGQGSGVVLRFSDGRSVALEAGTEVAFHAFAGNSPLLILYRGHAVYSMAVARD